MPRRLIFKDSSQQLSTLPSGYTALVSTDGDLKKQVESTVTTLSAGGSTGPAGVSGATGPSGVSGATGPSGGGFSLTELGFTIESTLSVINQNITLPDNYVFTYPSPLTMGEGYILTVPSGTTLTIV